MEDQFYENRVRYSRNKNGLIEAVTIQGVESDRYLSTDTYGGLIF